MHGSLLPLEQEGSGMGTRICEHDSCPLLEKITFCTRKVSLYLYALLYNTLGPPAPFPFVGSGCLLHVPKGTVCLCRGWPAPGCLRQEACMTILFFPRELCSKAAS